MSNNGLSLVGIIITVGVVVVLVIGGLFVIFGNDGNSSTETVEQLQICEVDVVYSPGECVCSELSFQQNYEVDGQAILFCASEGLPEERLEVIDKLPDSGISADEVILPNGKTLEEYSKERGIYIDTENTAN